MESGWADANSGAAGDTVAVAKGEGSVRPRLWHRWFLLSAGLVLLALAAALWVQARGFERGLLAYARGLEQARLPTIAERLADEYRQAGGWWRLQEQPRRWLRLLRPEGRGEGDAPRPPRPASALGALPPRDPQAARARALDFLQRLSLLDADGTLLHGPEPGKAAQRQPIEVDGRLVGFVALTPMPELYETAIVEFAAQQRRRAGWIALPVLGLAVLASWALSRRLLRRLAVLAEASRRLAGGDYGVRVGRQGGDELGELARDFDRMAESLQQAQQARDRWIADISHELRTPLTVLRGELQALQDGVRRFDAAALASLLDESARLAQRIDDLYALALSDSGGLRYRFAPVDLAGLVARVVEARQPAFTASGLRLELRAASPAWLQRGDAARLEQLVDNLLGNALRYTDAGGEVRVEVRSDDRQVELRVEDSAPGVSAEEMPQLLDRHYRGDSGRRRAGGAGLGLAICRNIAEAHGGDIRLADSPLGGLQVRVRLPADGATA